MKERAKAQKNAEDAKKDQEEKRKKLEEEKKKNADQIEPSEDLLLEGACNRTTFGIPNLKSMQLDRFLTEFNSMQSCDPKAYYDPDDPTSPCAPTSLNLPICSFDDNTTSTESGLCRQLIVCENGSKPDKFCRCSLPGDVTQIQGIGCAAWTCPTDTIPVSTAIGCSCQPIEELDKPPIFPPLFPLAPLETILQIENPKKIDMSRITSEFESQPLETWGKYIFLNQSEVEKDTSAEPTPEADN